MDGEIGNEEMHELVEAEDAHVIDIRSPAAFQRGHIPGSENVPLPSLVDTVERFEGADRVVTVCPKGKSSVQAARLIASYEGFDGRVESFEPGLSGWEGPIEDGGEAATDGAGDEGPDAPF
ncbi:rhodanese-like domain-containing protein [Haloarcula sp. S1CR25-12]|uniref:Rhodanese-like domain-containing protein n=1 Tax=Haloarcula saliterrae TaxID=2950534 RepID=A0ABU2FH30_9EURY|nr:rhodanese-like domain-containing protein [Haloarcula sp. S1CR25-12]MDS0261547.1 rhodanese-like domain-containing protein [Haloarcula sp. S1CR25-12]